MNRRRYLFLFLLGLGLAVLSAAFQDAPGYMDADYYFAGGLRLAQGHGFSEQIIWNYLDDPAGLPRPSHAYWMPLSSILAWLGMILVPFVKPFGAARLGFILAAGLIAPLTAHLAFSITSQRQGAMLSGILAAFSGFYLPFLSTTDAFGLYMLLGSLFILLVGKDLWGGSGHRWLFVLGLVAGLMHLTRADGLLWLGVAGMLVISTSLQQGGANAQERITQTAKNLTAVFAGYVMIMGPWIWRNLGVFGTPFAPGGTRTLWLTDYDELFAFPAALLTPARWLQTGWPAILKARFWALGQNLQTGLAVQGMVFLAPLVLVGGWQLRQDRRVKTAGLAWLLTLLVMSVVFPFSGARGGFFHSGAALQPLIWAMAPLGLDTIIRWAGRRRGWPVIQAQRVFRMGLVVLAAGLTGLLMFQRLVVPVDGERAWGAGQAAYTQLADWLDENGASLEDSVMVGNPPGFYAVSGRSALAVPNGDEATVLAVAKRYGVRYLLLEKDHPRGLDEIYLSPAGVPGLRYMATLATTHVFIFDDLEP